MIELVISLALLLYAVAASWLLLRMHAAGELPIRSVLPIRRRESPIAFWVSELMWLISILAAVGAAVQSFASILR